MFTILICGDRRWASPATIKKRLIQTMKERDLSPSQITIIHGDACGADRLGAWVAKSLGIKDIRAFPADWEKHGKKAGPIRNRQMLEENKVDLILAFHDDIGESKGTKDMICLAYDKEVPVRLYRRKKKEE